MYKGMMSNFIPHYPIKTVYCCSPYCNLSYLPLKGECYKKHSFQIRPFESGVIKKILWFKKENFLSDLDIFQV